jgi:N-methylhydantoinase A/oxoprolinase/acetone carboxylase beta subunit
VKAMDDMTLTSLLLSKTLSREACQELSVQGFAPTSIDIMKFLNLRFKGTDTAMMTTSNPHDPDDFKSAFEEQYM